MYVDLVLIELQERFMDGLGTKKGESKLIHLFAFKFGC
jgi:hypothetical protein